MIVTKDLLESLGFSNIIENSKEFRTTPIYRDSANNTSLRIKKDTGYWTDFSANISGNFFDLIKLSLNLSSVDSCRKWLENKNIDYKTQAQDKEKIFVNTDAKFSVCFKSCNLYWNNRGISDTTLNLFGGGSCDDRRMNGRYVFPIYNSRKEIIGLAGRDIYNNSKRPKWKLLGNKNHWVYPASINNKEILNKKSVILVEGISDCLSLFECGITNVICLFGIKMNQSIINFLMKCNIKKIIISTNNDLIDNNNAVGNKAADIIKKNLMDYFDESIIKINIPKEFNDWGDALIGKGKQYIISQFN